METPFWFINAETLLQMVGIRRLWPCSLQFRSCIMEWGRVESRGGAPVMGIKDCGRDVVTR